MRTALLPTLALCLAACGSTPASPPFHSAAEQIEHGGQVFASSCARCHGAAGEGTKKAPALVGAGALPLAPRAGQERKAPFHTALDVATFVTQAMPPDEGARAKLTERDDWAVLAFALSASGVALREPVGPANAAAIVLHP